MELVHEIERIAKQRGCSTGQIALAWVKYRSGSPDFPDIIPPPSATASSRIGENTKILALTNAEYKELIQGVENFEIVGRDIRDSDDQYVCR